MSGATEEWGTVEWVAPPPPPKKHKPTPERDAEGHAPRWPHCVAERWPDRKPCNRMLHWVHPFWKVEGYWKHTPHY